MNKYWVCRMYLLHMSQPFCLHLHEEVGNPFEDESADLLVLNTKDIVSTEVVDTVKNITHIGQRQYDEFARERKIAREV